MSETLYVSPAQVLAAKLSVELSEEAGEVPDEALKAIANAAVVADNESAPSQEAGDDVSAEQAEAELSLALERLEEARLREPGAQAVRNRTFYGQFADLPSKFQVIARFSPDEAGNEQYAILTADETGLIRKVGAPPAMSGTPVEDEPEYLVRQGWWILRAKR